MDTNGKDVYFADVYGKLAAPFESTFKDVRGGVELEYITGEQCISRLNETLGVAGWSFTIKEHGINAEADEAWVLGELSANFGGAIVVRQQFGSQKIKRSRASGIPLDIGFDLKGAATDALKKCAMLLGVGLYLSKKEVPLGGQRSSSEAAQAEAEVGEVLTCADCGSDLKETRFSAQDAALYVEPNNEAKFAGAIVTLMDRPVLRKKMGELGRERVERELQWSVVSQELVRAYETLLKRPAVKPASQEQVANP